MKKLSIILLILTSSLLCGKAAAQDGGYDVFVPISKYIVQGDSDALAAWFDDNLEISIMSRESSASRAQAKQIVKAFFDSYKPESFSIMHTAGRTNMKYALGNLRAGDDNFQVTIFVCADDNQYRIQQFKIEESMFNGPGQGEPGRGPERGDPGRGRGRGERRR